MLDARQATGIYTICPTPFDESGELDLASIHKLVDFQVDAGVKGLAVLGFLGEAHKLTSAERHEVAKTYIQASAGRLPVWVGVRALGLAGAIEQSREAQALGANAVFAAPLDGANDAQQFKYYEALAKAVDIPVIIHDFPGSFGTEVSTEVVARLGLEGGVNIIKVEEPPVGPKITKIRELAGDSMRIFGGLGGVYLLEELERGAVGTMTGFAFPEILVAIFDQFTAGDIEAAATTFDRYCPLLRYEFQPKLGLALRKYIYMRRGVLGSTHVRAPGMNIDRYTMAELERAVERVGLSLDIAGRQTVI